jgi:hypothetical protein
MLILPGSDDPQYTPSKVYPYILAGTPLLAVLHDQSGACDVIRSTRAGRVVTFGGSGGAANELYRAWREMLEPSNGVPETDWQAFEPYTAREMTRRQCEFFERVIEQRE